uniref:DNA-directed DNA polymerase n=1 Tax=Panagrolaimus davidi TaxID=227884 RepID=A0A914PEI1_9BILA
MDPVTSEINECEQRILLLERRLSQTNNFQALAISSELVEAKLRLKLLLRNREHRHGCKRTQVALDDDIEMEGSGTKKPNYGNIDMSKPRTLAEMGWLQDIEDLKGTDDIGGTFENQPLSHFLKLSNPVDKGSSSRGTVVFETGALITNVEDAKNPDDLITVIFQKLFERAFIGKSKPPDLLNLQFYGDGMVNPYYIPMRSPEMNNIDALKAQFKHLSTSETLSSIFNNNLAVKICAYWSPSGAGCTHDICPRVVNSGNKDDNFCLARALSYGVKWLECDGTISQNYLINGLNQDTVQLMQRSGIDMGKSEYSLIDAQKLIETLGEQYRLVVYDEFRQVILNTKYAPKVLVLQLKNNHFDFIPKLNLFLNLKKVCLQCLQEVHPYSHPKNCEKLCFNCMTADYNLPHDREGNGIYCQDCGFRFGNQECFNLHKIESKIKKHTLCSMRKICGICGKVKYVRDKRHNCIADAKFGDKDTIICNNCNIEHTAEAPFCYINPKTPKTPKSARYIIYDIECYTDGIKHVPISLYCITICTTCIDAKVDTEDTIKSAPKNCACGSSDSRHQFFHGYDGSNPVEKFLDFIFKRSNSKSDNAKSIVVAQNSSNVEVKVPGKAAIVFKDSLNFFMAPLKSLPKMFEFQEEASKLYFPLGWLKKENLHISLPNLPPVEFYWIDQMKSDARAEFLSWYEIHKNTPFCLSRDLQSYNKMDVVVLMKAVLKFREIMLEVTGIDPFLTSTTIASYAFKVFRSNYLKPNMIVNVSERGYRKHEQQSEEALKFMRLYEFEHGVAVQDATYAAGEFKIPNTNFKVDGVVKNQSGDVLKVLEYNSCFHHGCLKCFKPQQILAGGVTAIDLNERTKAREREISKQFTVESYWSCEVKSKLKSNHSLKAFYSEIKLPPRLQLRDSALKGGRVECFKMFHKCQPGEEIRCIDVNSLYPYSQKYGIYPIGNPKILTHESFKGIRWSSPEHNKYRGFILAKILPPKKIQNKCGIPLLAYSSANGNLVFALCRCCSDLMAVNCKHNEEERSWIACYTHLEVNKALSIGYEFIEIYEVWDYERFSEPGTENDLFGDYCNTFLKLKCESSGWPKDVDHEKYVDDYKKREGIALDPQKITVNNGKRTVAKLMANSLWGKLAQRSNLSKIEITKSAQAFHILMNDNTIEVLDITHINESTDRLVTRKKEEFQAEGKTTCLPVACFVTSQARLKLYEFMEQVDGLILYVDTDSIFYVLRHLAIPVEEGIYLGQMNREYAESVILEFICAGPKNYGLLMKLLEEIKAHIKVRGFPIDYNASQLLTYEEMKRKVFEKL